MQFAIHSAIILPCVTFTSLSALYVVLPKLT